MKIKDQRHLLHLNGASHFTPDQSMNFKSEISEAEYH